jgi:hypothetical protein
MTDRLHQEQRERRDFGAAPAANLAAVPPAASHSESWSGDLRAARRLILFTIAGAIVVGGGIEWAGWQIVHRHVETVVPAARSLFGVPVIEWTFGLLRNAGGAIAVGIGAAGLAMLRSRSWKRHWRTVGSAFAVGTAAVLVALAALTAWAP